MQIILTLKYTSTDKKDIWASLGTNINKWCEKYCKGEWTCIGSLGCEIINPDLLIANIRYSFEDLDDLMLVRLVWGGKVEHG